MSRLLPTNLVTLTLTLALSTLLNPLTPFVSAAPIHAAPAPLYPRQNMASSQSENMASSQSATCALKGRPAGKVLMGYWENWDGSSNGVHPGFGWTPIENPDIMAHGYNVITLAFPNINPDGTAIWQDGMDATVKVPTPAEM